MLNKKTIMLTGASGFLGRQLMQVFPEYNVIGLNSKNDLTDIDECKRLLYYNNPDIIVHAAALVGGLIFNSEHSYDMISQNLLMGLNLITESVKRKIPRFVLIGTTCSYPKFTPTPFKESDWWNGPVEETNSKYGYAKKILGELCIAAREQYDLDYIQVVPTNMVGENDIFNERSHVLPAAIKIIDAAKRNGTCAEFVGSRHVTRDLISVIDAAKAIRICLEKYHSPEPINIGTGIEVSMEKLLYKVADQMDFPRDRLVWKNLAPGQPKRALDITKLSQLGWRQQISLDESIFQTIKDYYAKQ